jgi:hypothetical protein
VASYVMTVRRRAALRKAQLASARKRRGKGKSRGKSTNTSRQVRRSRNVAIVAAAGGLFGASMAMGYGKQNRSLKIKNRQAAIDLEVAKIHYRGMRIQRDMYRGAAQARRKNYSKARPRPTRVKSQRIYPTQLALPRGST